MTSSTPDPESGTIASYDRGAIEYAEHSSDRSALHHLHTRFRELLYPRALVLDLGCGPGHDAAELTHEGLDVVGLDPALGLLTQARNHMAVARRLVAADGRALPFTAASFDGVWACASLLHVPRSQIRDALAEIVRVLKPGGIVFTSMQQADVDRPVAFDPGGGLPERVYYFYREQEWAQLVEGAGMELLSHRLGASTGGLNFPDSGAWIESFARKP